mmetsp:Transcript_20768/g.66716  ORF Transcript_20768/g.66716 Transcript_20768/m.66716 type:complete len:213 (-) Transcript_20768:704-1342(-)
MTTWSPPFPPLRAAAQRLARRRLRQCDRCVQTLSTPARFSSHRAQHSSRQSQPLSRLPRLYPSPRRPALPWPPSRTPQTPCPTALPQRSTAGCAPPLAHARRAPKPHQARGLRGARGTGCGSGSAAAGPRQKRSGCSHVGARRRTTTRGADSCRRQAPPPWAPVWTAAKRARRAPGSAPLARAAPAAHAPCAAGAALRAGSGARGGRRRRGE